MAMRNGGPIIDSLWYTYNMGMIGFDGGGWHRTASREAPNSLNQRT